jgi:hypothetical protein
MGAQFILLWILGEYVGRIYNEARRRPLYVVDEKLGFAATDSQTTPADQQP